MSEIFKNRIVKNIIRAVVLMAGLFIATGILLNVVTRHNKELTVPDMNGMTVRQAARAAVNAGMCIDVVDSIYVKRMPRGCVVRQDPKAGASVKHGRRIRLVINAITPKKIPMPDLVGYSLRSANAELACRGLELGRLIYVSDMATNDVLSQLSNNAPIAPGTMVPSESTIDLVLGLNNNEENMTRVPNVIGKRYRTAVDRIHDNSLNVGSLVFDKNIRSYQDSVNAVVYRQTPSSDAGDITLGRPVTIYLTLDADKIPEGVTIEK